MNSNNNTKPEIKLGDIVYYYTVDKELNHVLKEGKVRDIYSGGLVIVVELPNGKRTNVFSFMLSTDIDDVRERMTQNKLNLLRKAEEELREAEKVMLDKKNEYERLLEVLGLLGK